MIMGHMLESREDFTSDIERHYKVLETLTNIIDWIVHLLHMQTLLCIMEKKRLVLLMCN